MRLDGRGAIVTGAANGLGLSIARTLSREGARVALADLDRENAEKAASELVGAISIQLDVRDRDAVKAAMEKTVSEFGRLDILVNNAGVQRIAPIDEFDEAHWEVIIGTMLTGTFLCTKHALPHLRRSSSGRVINIASVHGLVASPFKSAYVAAKHGVLGFTKALALEEAANGVTANAVCPSYIRTALAEEQVTDQAQANNMTEAEALEEIILQPVAIKRLLEPEEVSELVVYLASDLASGITGSAIPIDCGWTAR
ncbi:MAG TPA: 3-hydroxybutyrate dehydrogenase [Gammaproteobacteria bacterium]|nr:3-hydroxybutyrate dehydrogenase [Gammaproteobacteria bacterium]